MFKGKMMSYQQILFKANYFPYLNQKPSPTIKGILNLVNLLKIYREKSGDSYRECLKTIKMI